MDYTGPFKGRAWCLWWLWIYQKFLMLAKHITWRQTDYHTYLFSASLPSVCLQVWAWKTCQTCCQSLSLHLSLQTWLETHTHMHTRTHTEKHASLACFSKHAQPTLHLCTPSPVQTHSYNVSRALLPMKEPSHACTHRLRHNQESNSHARPRRQQERMHALEIVTCSSGMPYF